MQTLPYILSEVTDGNPVVIEEPISVQMAQDWLRKDVGEGYDPTQDPDGRTLTELITEVRRAAEETTGTILVPRLMAWDIGGWWSAKTHPVPVRPIKEVVSLSYFNEGGTETTLALDTDFGFIRTGQDTGALGLYLTSRPALHLPRPYPIRVTFRAGYGREEIPGRIMRGMRAMLGEAFENRTDTVREKKSLSDTYFEKARWPTIG